MISLSEMMRHRRLKSLLMLINVNINKRERERERLNKMNLLYVIMYNSLMKKLC